MSLNYKKCFPIEHLFDIFSLNSIKMITNTYINIFIYILNGFDFYRGLNSIFEWCQNIDYNTELICQAVEFPQVKLKCFFGAYFIGDKWAVFFAKVYDQAEKTFRIIPLKAAFEAQTFYNFNQLQYLNHFLHSAS